MSADDCPTKRGWYLRSVWQNYDVSRQILFWVASFKCFLLRVDLQDTLRTVHGVVGKFSNMQDVVNNHRHVTMASTGTRRSAHCFNLLRQIEVLSKAGFLTFNDSWHSVKPYFFFIVHGCPEDFVQVLNLNTPFSDFLDPCKSVAVRTGRIQSKSPGRSKSERKKLVRSPT